MEDKMAYLKKDQTVFFAEGNITSIVEKVAFRKYRGKVKDKETGEWKMKWKSMPYAICRVMMSEDAKVPMETKFLIAGYRLRKKYFQGKMILVMDNEYIADYEKEYGNQWVARMIEQEDQREAERQARIAAWKEKKKKSA
jgi:hypothetical protein